MRFFHKSDKDSRTTSRRAFWFADFLCKKAALRYRLPLLFHKKAHSRRLFACKRAHNAFGSLLPFCDIAHFVRLKILDFTMFFNKFCKNTRTTSEQALLAPIFCCTKNQSSAPLLLLFREKSRSVRLFNFMYPHNGSLSLSPFCELQRTLCTLIHIEAGLCLFRFLLFMKTQILK